MFKNILLSFGAFFFASLLLIIYFIKAKQTGINNKVFKIMLSLLILEIVTEIAAITAIFYVRDNDAFVEIICRIHQFFSLSWILSVGLYGITIGKAYKIDNIMEYLLKEKEAKPVLISIILTGLMIPFTTYENVIEADGAYMAGSGEYIQYIVGLFIIGLVTYTFRVNKKEFSRLNLKPIYWGIIAVLFQMGLQLYFPLILITTECFVFITYLFYFSFENPDLYLIKELEEAKKKADDSNKTKTEFLSNMSHEIRTPINAIIGFSEGIINEQELNREEALVDLSHIQAAGNNLLEIINNILDISKIENGEEYIDNKEYDVSNLLMELKTIMDGRLIDKKIRFVLNVDQNVPSKLYGDRTKIFQILLNILSNSSKYTEVGRITLTLNAESTNGNTLLKIKVADTGYGIKKEDFDKLFEKFSRLDNTTKKEIEGTGLGLLITKNLVTLMKGKIWFDSVYGAGTTFYVEIPQKIVDSTPLGELKLDNTVEEEATHLDCSGKTILLVDDNKLNLLVAEKLLKPYNLTIEKFNNGDACINSIKEGKHYDLIFMDIMMPELSGEEVLHVLRKLDGYQIPPVIALTANAIAGAKEKYLREGFNDYLSKPINTKELDRIINKYFKSTNEKEVESTLELLESSKRIPMDDKIEYLKDNGIDVNAAITNLQDINAFNEVLYSFYNDIDNQILSLENALNNPANYAIIAHGLKGDCNTIGISDLAKLCSIHEQKGEDQDLTFINAQYNNLKTSLLNYKKVLEKYFSN